MEPRPWLEPYGRGSLWPGDPWPWRPTTMVHPISIDVKPPWSQPWRFYGNGDQWPWGELHGNEG
jgi:hypothetical protein